MQPARRGHRKPLCSADEKVARGGVATAFGAAVAELGFLSAHSGSAQGCGKDRRQGWGAHKQGVESEQNEKAGAGEWVRREGSPFGRRQNAQKGQWRDERRRGWEGRDSERRRTRKETHTRHQVCPAARASLLGNPPTLAPTLISPGEQLLQQRVDV